MLHGSLPEVVQGVLRWYRGYSHGARAFAKTCPPAASHATDVGEPMQQVSRALKCMRLTGGLVRRVGGGVIGRGLYTHTGGTQAGAKAQAPGAAGVGGAGAKLAGIHAEMQMAWGNLRGAIHHYARVWVGGNERGRQIVS